MKQKYNINKSYLLLSLVVLTTKLFSYTNDSILQEILEQRYTTNDSSKLLFTKKLDDLSNKDEDTFILGKSFFKIPWVQAPAATSARDGLGPLFSANTCVSCHINNARAHIYNNNNISRAYTSRLSIPSKYTLEHNKLIKYQGFIPDKVYGSQISINGTKDVKYEAKPIIKYKNKSMIYDDKKIVILSEPIHGVNNQLSDFSYGKLNKNTNISNRIAPSLIGLGLLDALSDEQILANEDINDKNNDGISGKANIVYSLVHKDFRVGRFTTKASVATVLEQSAAAAINDMGLTSYLFPKENCTNSQKKCLEAPKGDVKRQAGELFDLSEKRIKAISFYLKNLKTPKSIITQTQGEKLFKQIGCVKCHIPSFTLKNGYNFKAFTDLLLHDMGKELSDGRNEFLAKPTEWRTAPLWGIGKYKTSSNKSMNLLHDGRAKNIEEAILWHGGESLEIKEKFMKLSQKQRIQIIKYIEEL